MISDRAHVDPSAKIGKDVTIHAFAYIDKDVEIGDGCEIMPYASILLPALALCLFFANWTIPFYTVVVASFLWIGVLAIWHIKAIRERRKVKISPLLSNMKRRMRWF